jgi:hypothetical protein
MPAEDAVESICQRLVRNVRHSEQSPGRCFDITAITRSFVWASNQIERRTCWVPEAVCSAGSGFESLGRYHDNEAGSQK